MIPNVIATNHARKTANRVDTLRKLTRLSKQGDLCLTLSREDLEEIMRHRNADGSITLRFELGE